MPSKGPEAWVEAWIVPSQMISAGKMTDAVIEVTAASRIWAARTRGLRSSWLAVALAASRQSTSTASSSRTVARSPAA